MGYRGKRVQITLSPEGVEGLNQIRQRLIGHKLPGTNMVVTEKTRYAELVRIAFAVLDMATHNALEEGGDPDVTAREMFPGFWK